MGEVLEGAGEGQVVRLRLRGQDVVHPWLLCGRQTGRGREERGGGRRRARGEKRGQQGTQELEPKNRGGWWGTLI